MKKFYFLLVVLSMAFTGYSQATKDYLNRGLAKIKIQDYTGAIADFTKAIEIDPKDADAYNDRGVAKCELQDYRGAIVDFTQAIELNSIYSDAYYNRANAKGEIQDYNGEIADYTKAIEIDPKAEGYFKRGLAKGLLKDYRGAIVDYTQAIELNPKYAEAFYFRGGAELLLEQKDSGCLDLSKAGELGYTDAYEKIKKYCQ